MVNNPNNTSASFITIIPKGIVNLALIQLVLRHNVNSIQSGRLVI